MATGKKETPLEVQLDEGFISKSNEGMKMTTTVPSSAARRCEPAAITLKKIRSDIEDLVQRRESLLLTAQAELIAAGIPAFIVTSVAPQEQRERNGDRGLLVETFFELGASVNHGYRFMRTSQTSHEPGPYVCDIGLLIEHGVFEVLLADDDQLLVAQTESPSSTEKSHRLAVSRLRNLARRHGLTVSVRDREIRIITPFNDSVHIGDLVSAFKWLTGNLETASVLLRAG